MTFNPKNAILAEIEPAIALKFTAQIERVELNRGDVLQETGAEILWVWFPDDALICMASESVEGESISGGMVGRNGTFGAFEACGSRISYSRALVQIGGIAWRIRAAHYRDLFDHSANLRVAIHKQVEALLVEARQLVACTAIHRVESRMCRVLLDASARSHKGSHLTLTQEELANILGVQRSTIAVTSSALQRGGLIRSRRGGIDIIDFGRLEAAACSCRRTIAYAQQEIYRAPDDVCEG
ncbi:MAG: Crp/Fnr family transcriptional regulator [Sphingomonas sp.]|uniref:Crp/Fnr family transcriptional regulator n=1 Tax=Sphingomonas sp. TaxID=28214 RepID=UPI001B0BB179|nr:Crp/Fnr family transcriptional regulator [Sphingomonas sp.]MBO9621655.1 Crp/Fnr family transcriptional regulator [Sphingomonas sp.]